MLDAMNILHLLAYHRRFAVGVTLVGLGFFGALTIHSFLRPNKRIYLPGLLLIDLSSLASLVRTLFFFDLSPHPTRLGGIWRLAAAAVMVWGFVLFLRTWQQERANGRRN